MFWSAKDLSFILLLSPDLPITSFPTEQIARSIPNSLGVWVFLFVRLFFLIAVLLTNTAKQKLCFFFCVCVALSAWQMRHAVIDALGSEWCKLS